MPVLRSSMLQRLQPSDMVDSVSPNDDAPDQGLMRTLSSLLAFDLASLRALRSRARDEPRDSYQSALTESLAASFVGEAPGEGVLSQIEASARAAGDAANVIIASALGAFVALAKHDLAKATTEARRASRMARTEALAQPEYFASIVLARVRRSAGTPHLALHILAGVAARAPAPWQAWIQYESTLAGSDAEPAEASPAYFLWQARRAAASGERDSFDEAREELSKRLRGFGPWEREARELLDLVDANAERAPAPNLSEWAAGLGANVPLGFHAFGLDPHGGVASVLVQPNVASRRFLRVGKALFSAPVRSLVKGERPRERTDTGIARLALAPDRTLEDSDFFAALYGVPYDERHKSALDALILRMREALGDAATLKRAKGRLSLHVETPLWVDDPRCEQPLEDRILRALAVEGSTTARDISASLSVALRTVQEALRDLTEAGACLKERRGRAIEYRVEDTTFSEPTEQTKGPA